MSSLIHYLCFLLLLLSCYSFSQDVITCNGFVKSDHLIDYSRVDVSSLNLLIDMILSRDNFDPAPLLDPVGVQLWCCQGNQRLLTY